MIKRTKPNKYQYFIWPQDYSQNLVLELMHFHNRWNGIAITYRNEDYVDVMIYAFDRNAPDKTNFFLNNLPILTEFMQYFKAIFADTLDHADKRKIAVYKEKFDLSYAGDSLRAHTDQVTKQIRKAGLVIETDHGPVKLSGREVECLRLIGTGKTAKEAGQLLSLSYRTVESYLETARRKANDCSTSELLNIASLHTAEH